MPQYHSAGASATNAIVEALEQRRVRDRQEVEDAYRKKREQQIDEQNRKEQADQQEARAHAAKVQDQQLEMQKKESEDKLFEAGKNRHLKAQEGMMPGDIPDASFIADAIKYGTAGNNLKQEPSVTAPAIPAGQSRVQLPGGEGSTGIPPMPETTAPGMDVPLESNVVDMPGAQPTQPATSTPGAMRFLGAGPQRQNAALGKAVQSAKSREDVLGAALTAGENPTGAKALADASYPPGEAVYRTSADKRKVEEFVNGAWVSVTGPLKEKAHWLQENQPPTVNVNTQANQNNTRSDRSYALNIAQLDKLSSPLEQQNERMSRLIAAVDARTPQADSLIAPELLTVMAGGQGSGLRMNEAEISRIIGGRSKWETLKAKVQTWSADPRKALSLTDDQRNQVKELIAEVQKRSGDRLDELLQARFALGDATDPQVHRKIMADLHEKLYGRKEEPKDETATDAPPADPAARAKALIEKYGKP